MKVMNRFTLVIIACTLSSFSNAQDFIINNQTSQFLAYKVSGGGPVWCTGTVMFPRLLIAPHSSENWSVSAMGRIFLFSKENFAYIHLSNDCATPPIGYVITNLKSGLMTAGSMDQRYEVISGLYSLSVSEKVD